MHMKIGIGIIAALVILAGALYLLTRPSEAPAPESVQPSAAEGPATEATGVIREFLVTGGMMYFDPTTIEVDAGDTVRIVYQNRDGRHDWVIDEFDARTRILGPNESETIEFVASRSGEFEYYCSVGNHRAMGMRGTLIVR